MSLSAATVDEPRSSRDVPSLAALPRPDREQYRRAIREGRYVTDSPPPPGNTVRFVKLEGTYHRIDRHEEASGDGTDAAVLVAVNSYPTREALREAHVGVTVVPIREDVLADTFPVFEAAVQAGEYEAAPMTRRDCRAWLRIAGAFDDVLDAEWEDNLYWYDGQFFYVGWSFRNRPDCAAVLDG